MCLRCSIMPNGQGAQASRMCARVLASRLILNPYCYERLVEMKSIAQIGDRPDIQAYIQRLDNFMRQVKAARAALGPNAHVLTDFFVAICQALGNVFDASDLAEKGYSGFRRLQACLREHREGLPTDDNPFHHAVISFLQEREHILNERRFGDICCVAMAKDALRIAADEYIRETDAAIKERLSDEPLATLRRSLCALLGEERTARLQESLAEVLLPVSLVAIFQQAMLFSLIDTLSYTDEDGNTALGYVLENQII